MNEKVMGCEEVESILPAYLEGELGDVERRAAERHADSCARCATLLHDVAAIVRDAGTLSALAPSRDLWPEIEARIQPDVLSLPAAREEKMAREHRATPRWATA
ncbi:MAG TPA: zf-HC2 domain-containing protein, partial [Gemmatimonadaceae bacterium]